jgi:hypothetical protein
MSLVVGMSVPNDFSVIEALFYTMTTFLLVSLYVSEITHAKIIHKLIYLEETNHELTEVVVELNEKMHTMNSKWKQKYWSLKNKITKLRDATKEDFETFQTAMDFQDTMNCEEFVNVKESIATIETTMTFREKYMNERPELHDLLQLLNRIDDSISNDMNDVRLELVSCNERIQMETESNGETRLEVRNLNESIVMSLNMMEHVIERVDVLEKDTMYAYGKCVLHTSMGYGNIASPVVDGNIHVLFDYPPFIVENHSPINVKCSDITIKPRKSRKAHPQDIFRIQQDGLEILIRGFWKLSDKEQLMCSCGIICDEFGYGYTSNGQYKVNNIQNLSVLSNLDTESTCLLRNDKCTIVRVKTFCTQLNDYTG